MKSVKRNIFSFEEFRNSGLEDVCWDRILQLEVEEVANEGSQLPFIAPEVEEQHQEGGGRGQHGPDKGDAIALQQPMAGKNHPRPNRIFNPINPIRA